MVEKNGMNLSSGESKLKENGEEFEQKSEDGSGWKKIKVETFNPGSYYKRGLKVHL